MTTEKKLIKNKLGLLHIASHLKNVSEACRRMGYSRDTYYPAKKAYEDGGLEASKRDSLTFRISFYNYNKIYS